MTLYLKPARYVLSLGIAGLCLLTALLPDIVGGCGHCRPHGMTDIPRDRFVRVSRASEIAEVIVLQGAGLQRVRAGVVARRYIRSLPDDLTDLRDIEDRKRSFILAVLPQVIRLNEGILRDRTRAMELWLQMDDGQVLSTQHESWLSSIATLYGIEPGQREQLLRRLDVIPPSLALAQASIESGWGTSRFAQKGNAIFGQRTFDDEGHGLNPSDLDEADFRVKAFKSIMRSVWGYMLTLNTHEAYRAFRATRAAQRASGTFPQPLALARTLDRYSEEGDIYVDLVRRVIRSNRLQEFDRTRLANTEAN